MSETMEKDDYDSEIILANIIEEIVKEKVKEMMDTIDMCHCKICYYNACAIALNSLTPYYVTTEKGSLFTKVATVNMQYQTDLTVIVMKAIMKVKDSPQH